MANDTERLKGAIEVLRGNMGTASVASKKNQWKIFMGVLAVCIEDVGQEPYGDFLRLIGEEYEKGHAN